MSEWQMVVLEYVLASKLWTHFSMYAVWPNVTEAEIAELEGLFREIYRKDKRANALNRQRRCRQLQNVRIRDWNE
jgi:hypothetical protein